MDIVERLRNKGTFLNPDGPEGADEIERLRNKVQWLDMVETTVIKQHAEIDGLREALQKIDDLSGSGDCCSAYEILVLAKKIARAALKEGE